MTYDSQRITPMVVFEIEVFGLQEKDSPSIYLRRHINERNCFWEKLFAKNF